MEQIKYLDFDMLIESSEGGYSVRVLSSPAGEASAQFVLPFSDLELDNIALQLGRTRRGVRRLESPEMEVARNFGRRLFEAVFSQGVRDRLRGSLGSVNRQNQGLRLRLRMAGAPELANLPWEYLYDPSLDRFLVLSVQTPLVRFLEVPQPDRPLTVSPPLNVAVMISNPKDYEPLEVEREWDNLKAALGGLEQQGLVTLHRLEESTLDGLLRKLRTDEYHVFHFIGHGGFDRQAEDGVLVLEDEHGNSRLVSGRFLGTILNDHRSLRLAILNACEGARTSRNDPFAGVAQSLVQQGIPSVIAMQFEITDQAAITFSHELYGAITDGYPVDAALAESRKAIFAQDNDVEWGTPVLYLTAPDGVIFDVMPTETKPVVGKVEAPLRDFETEKQIEQLYTDALSAFWLEDWEQASQLFRSILDLQPEHAEAATRLSEAERQLGLMILYSRATEAEDQEDWTEALKVLEELSTIDPNYQDVPERIERVRQQSQLAALYHEAQQLHQAGKWQAVITVFANIKAIDPDYPDPENLRATAEENAAAEQRQAELESLYSRAVREMDAENWETAQDLFLQVQEIESGYQQSERLLERVQTELARQTEESQRAEEINNLYEEARSLAKIEKWAQVRSRMEEIIQLDPQFADPDGLADKSQRALEKESQQVEQAKQLAAMYSEAVQLVKAGNNEGALAKWEQIQAVDSSYPDSHKVFEEASQGLKGSASPSNAVTTGLKIPVLNKEWTIVFIAYGWFLVQMIITSVQLGFVSPPLTGLLFGFVLWIGLRFRIPILNKFHLTGLALGWAAGFSIVLLGGGEPFLITIVGSVGGLVTATVIYRAIPNLPLKRLAIITIGWVTSFFISRFVIEISVLGNPNLEVGIGFCVAGLLGSWVTLNAIRKGPVRRPNWTLVTMSIIGFIAGVLLANAIIKMIIDGLINDESLIFLFALLSIAVWGFLGAASLGIPSRNFREIVLLGGAGAIGMLLGVLLWDYFFGIHDRIDWNLNNLHERPDIILLLGLGFGLVLGLTTRRISAALILAIAGITAFMLATYTVVFWAYPLWWLRAISVGAIIGAFIGLAWGYLEQSDSVTSE